MIDIVQLKVITVDFVQTPIAHNGPFKIQPSNSLDFEIVGFQMNREPFREQTNHHDLIDTLLLPSFSVVCQNDWLYNIFRFAELWKFKKMRQLCSIRQIRRSWKIFQISDSSEDQVLPKTHSLKVTELSEQSWAKMQSKSIKKFCKKIDRNWIKVLWASYSSWHYQNMARLNYGRAYLHGCTFVQQNIGS